MSPEQARGQAGRQAHRHLGVRLRALRDADRARRRSRATRSRTRSRRSSSASRTGRRCRRRHPHRSDGSCAAASRRIRSSGCETSATSGLRSTPSTKLRLRRPAAPRTGLPATWLPWLVTAALGFGLAGVIAWNLRSLPLPGVTRFLHDLPQGQQLNGSRGAHIVAMSPDGSRMAYSGRRTGSTSVHVGDRRDADSRHRELSSSASRSSRRTADRLPSSPSANRRSRDQRRRAARPELFCRSKPCRPASLGGWLHRVRPGTEGESCACPRMAARPRCWCASRTARSACNPQMLPDGEHVIFTLAAGTAPSRWDKARIVVESLRLTAHGGHRRRQRCPLSFIRASPVCARRGLYPAPFDASGSRVTGDPLPDPRGRQAILPVASRARPIQFLEQWIPDLCARSGSSASDQLRLGPRR